MDKHTQDLININKDLFAVLIKYCDEINKAEYVGILTKIIYELCYNDPEVKNEHRQTRNN